MLIKELKSSEEPSTSAVALTDTIGDSKTRVCKA